MNFESNPETNELDWEPSDADAARGADEGDAQADEGDPDARAAAGPAGEMPREDARAGGRMAGAVETDDLRDRYLRLAAEYDNYRKRTDRERVEARDRSQAQLVERLLEPLDDLQRVAQFKTETTTADALLEGVRMVERKLMRALEAAGLELMDAHGRPFDPAVHEAIMTAATDDAAEDDTVGEVFQPGYLFRGALIRPARVQVRKHD